MYFSCRVVLHYEIISSKICLIDGSLFLLLATGRNKVAGIMGGLLVI
jgi:hypothetical protein